MVICSSGTSIVVIVIELVQTNCISGLICTVKSTLEFACLLTSQIGCIVSLINAGSCISSNSFDF